MEYRHLVKVAPPGLLTPPDRTTVEHLAWVNARIAEIGRLGGDEAQAKGIGKLILLARSLTAELGYTPSSRTRIKVEPPSGTDAAEEKLFGQTGGV